MNEFWSITMYNLPQRLLVAITNNGHLIGDCNQGLKLGADGSLKIYLQHDKPGPNKVATACAAGTLLQ